MESQCRKPRSKRAQREEIGGQLLTDNLIGEIDRLDAIGKQTARAAELLKGLIDQAAQTKITVDVETLQEHSDKLTRELKKQVQHVKQPPIVLKVVIGLFVVSWVATWAAGYYIRECRVWEERAEYWYEQSQKVSEPPKPKKGK